MASAIIVFSHQRWDFAYRRAQHLLSRLAAHYAIVFIEPPCQRDGGAGFQMCSPAPNILVCQPHAPVDSSRFHDDHLPHLQEPLRELMHAYDDHIAWFYTPLALPLLQAVHPRLVVYDCVDAPASLPRAPRQLPQGEGALLQAADIVFAGGAGLARARRELHSNVHWMPDSVDAARFLPALDRANSHPAHRHIPGPRLGFYGVIDERFDIELIAQVADAHAQWQIVLVGPVTGIDPACLPQRTPVDSAVDAEIDLALDDDGYSLVGRLDVSLPGIDRQLGEELAHHAHQLCPYSKATRGNIDVQINLI